MKLQKNHKIKNIIYPKKYDPTAFDYDKYWLDRNGAILRERHIEIPKHLEDNSSVLDLACGDGILLQNIEMLRNNMLLCGVDISSVAVGMCQNKGIHASIGDIGNVDFELHDLYDYIILSECLEHLQNPESVLNKIRYKYNKGLIITIPNTGYFMHRLSLLFGAFPVQWIYHPSEHLRFWTLSDFNALLNNMNFSKRKVLSIKGIGYLDSIWPALFSQQLLFFIEPQKRIDK